MESRTTDLFWLIHDSDIKSGTIRLDYSDRKYHNKLVHLSLDALQGFWNSDDAIKLREMPSDWHWMVIRVPSESVTDIGSGEGLLSLPFHLEANISELHDWPVKKISKAFEMGIPGLPLANRGDSGGLGPEDAAISNRFFGGEDHDDHNENSQPVIKKRNERVDDPAYNSDDAANKYFQLLFGKVKSKHLKQRARSTP